MQPDDLEEVPLTEQDWSDLEEAFMVTKHGMGPMGGPISPGRTKRVFTALETANRIAVEHGFQDGSATLEGPGNIHLRARRRRST
jgi:hypothetical protein